LRRKPQPYRPRHIRQTRDVIREKGKARVAKKKGVKKGGLPN